MASFLEKQHSSRNGTTQTIAYSTTTAATNAFSSETYQLRLVANSACHYAIGDGAQTATTANPFLPANTVEYVTVNSGPKDCRHPGSNRWSSYGHRRNALGYGTVLMARHFQVWREIITEDGQHGSFCCANWIADNFDAGRQQDDAARRPLTACCTTRKPIEYPAQKCGWRTTIDAAL